jgi:hypothetical protein
MENNRICTVLTADSTHASRFAVKSTTSALGYDLNAEERYRVNTHYTEIGTVEYRHSNEKTHFQLARSDAESIYIRCEISFNCMIHG